MVRAPTARAQSGYSGEPRHGRALFHQIGSGPMTCMAMSGNTVSTNGRIAKPTRRWTAPPTFLDRATVRALCAAGRGRTIRRSVDPPTGTILPWITWAGRAGLASGSYARSSGKGPQRTIKLSFERNRASDLSLARAVNFLLVRPPEPVPQAVCRAAAASGQKRRLAP